MTTPHPNDWQTLTIAALIRRHGRHVPDETALRDGSRVVTYRELDRRTDRLAAALAASGVVRGGCIGALMVNSVPLLETCIAAAKLGAAVVTLNWRLVPEELDYILGDARPSVLFVSSALADLAESLTATIPRIVVAETAAACAYEALIEKGGALPEVLPQPTDPWLIIYTSGTTGRPKGCQLDQKGQVISALSTRIMCGLTPDDCLYIVLPLFHLGGMLFVLAHISAGATVQIAPRTFDAEQTLATMEQARCTGMAMAVPQYLSLVERLRERPRNLSLRTFSLGSGMHSASDIVAMREAFRAEPSFTYGQTESGGFVTWVFADKQLANQRDYGGPQGIFEVQIVDGNDQPVPVGEMGELCVRGVSVMIGYLNNPQATADTLRGGWLHTGDLFQMDKGGRLSMVGRKKELIKTGGENVYPREVEATLERHPAVAECVVFGVPHPRWTEAVKAVVVLRPGMSASRADLVAWCREQIAGYKRPRYLEFSAKLPRSENGKVLVRQLQMNPVTDAEATDAEYAAGHGSRP